MRMRFFSFLLCGILLLSFGVARPASAMFEAFSQLREDIEAMEKSSPDNLDDILQKLEGVSGTKFTDVQSGEWFHRYVTSLTRWGIASGYKDAKGNATGKFGPGNTVTVAEILKMALKSAQVDETRCVGKPALRQAESHWARPFVLCGEQRNMRLLRSSPDLNRSALRGEVLGVIFDAFGDNVPPLYAPFTDAKNHAYESDIGYAAALKMVSGDKDASGKSTGMFRPDAPVKRGEAAKMLYERLRVEVMENQK
ncbi:MAG: Uncharacterized protein Greene101449_89 [Candidatus Peregrinibacteria bacterium Greene1014_49]|nr:MAG: Uncharacterized protein Greene101449_89 [Candidatus Peregrinibacteria bacterium Greene1014_49]